MTLTPFRGRCLTCGHDHDAPSPAAVLMRVCERHELEVARLREALLQVAQAHAWLAFGECRGFGDAPLLSPSDADAVARVALAAAKDH